MMVSILLKCGDHLHNCIISPRGGAWVNKSSMTPPFVTEVPVPSRKSVRSCICVLEVMYLCVRGHVFVCQRSYICVLEVMYLCVRGHIFVCQRSCICVLGVSIWPLSVIFLFDFGTVLTVWYFLFFILLVGQKYKDKCHKK